MEWAQLDIQLAYNTNITIQDINKARSCAFVVRRHLYQSSFWTLHYYRRSESVEDVIYGLGRVNFKYLLLLRTVKFYRRLYFKSGLLHDVFWSFMILSVMTA